MGMGNSPLDLNNPELGRIFRDELEERSGRLVAGARALRDRTLAASAIPDLVRDAHTVKGSAGLLSQDVLREVSAHMEQMWKKVADGHTPDGEVTVALEAAAGRFLGAFDDDDWTELAELGEKLAAGLGKGPDLTEVTPLRQPEPGDLGGLLSSVSESLLGGVTRVDTGDLYRLINRVVEVSLDADALADLSLVSVEGSDQGVVRKTWRSQLMKLRESMEDIQGQAAALANVPLSDATATFHQFVRYLGRQTGKDVRLELIGDEILLDRQIVDVLRETLRHLLVNAVDHGIESPEGRLVAGKPATGTVQVRSALVGETVEISVTDDGAGIDWDRVVEKAIEEDLPFVRSDLVPVLFQPEFTTAVTVTDVSGNGEGLAAARDAVEQVHGVLRIESKRGEGTRATLTVPKSMVLQNVIVVATNGDFWGLPESFVEASMPLSKAEVRATKSGRVVRFESDAIPCVSLAEAVGHREPVEESELLVVGTRHGLVAITVSEVVDRRRVAVRNLGPIVEGPGYLTGAALLGGGDVLMVLDPNFLGLPARQRPTAVSGRPRVLVVDDSAGVRQVLSATLNGAGFEVDLAGGAREAMLAVSNSDFDALVVDYLMPRSNGIELVRALRASDLTVPIVMVSGVATEKEKRAAQGVGVDAYLDKFDLRQGVLTATLRRLIASHEADTA